MLITLIQLLISNFLIHLINKNTDQSAAMPEYRRRLFNIIWTISWRFTAIC